MSHRITVVIPTRERCDTLVWALKTCITQDNGNLEIIVSDNASSDATREVVEAACDPRVRYVNPGSRLSMSEHWEFALSHVQGDLVLFLGDDDGLVPEAISELSDSLGRNLVPLVWPVQQYFWPDFASPSLANSLIMPLAQPRTRRRVESQQVVEDVLAGRRLYTSLPSPYFGLVPTELLDRVRQRSGGVVFRSLTPDMYSGFAIAAVCDFYEVTEHSYSIAGQSARSNGASQLSGRAAEEGSEAARFWDENTISFHRAIAYAPSVPILIAEAFLQAQEHLQLKGELDIRDVLRAALRDPAYLTNPHVRPVIDAAVMRTAEDLGIQDHMRSEMRRGHSTLAIRMAKQALRSLVGGYPLVDLTDHEAKNVFEASLLVPGILEAHLDDGNHPLRRAAARGAKARRILRAARHVGR